MARLQSRAEHLFKEGEKDIAIGGRFDADAGQYALGGQRRQISSAYASGLRNRLPHPF